jgi:hypothetical protein
MTVEQFNDVLRAQPFRPFTIHMADGQKFHVQHRDFVSRSPTGRTVIVYGENDRFDILDLLLMTQLEVHPTGQPGEAA